MPADEPPSGTAAYLLTWRVTRDNSYDLICTAGSPPYVLTYRHTTITNLLWEGTAELAADGSFLSFAQSGHYDSEVLSYSSCSGPTPYRRSTTSMKAPPDGQPETGQRVAVTPYYYVRGLFGYAGSTYGLTPVHSESVVTYQDCQPHDATQVEDHLDFWRNFAEPVGDVPWVPCLGAYYKQARVTPQNLSYCALTTPAGGTDPSTLYDEWEVKVVPLGLTDVSGAVVSYRRADPGAATDPVRGICADGKSTVLVRIDGLPADLPASQVKIEVVDPEDGTTAGSPVLANGVATQVLAAPPEFSTTPEGVLRAERTLGLRVTVRGCEIPSPPLLLVRPPVLMLHGLWSDARTWSVLRAALSGAGYPEDRLVAAGYRNAVHLSENSDVLRTWITIALRDADRAGIVAKKVDVVAHSMGGLIAALYGRAEAGRIHSVVTLGTPYFGSQSADFLLSLPRASTSFLMRKLGKPIDLGAVEDLRYGRGGIDVFADSTGVPTLALAGIANKDGYQGSCHLPDAFLTAYELYRPQGAPPIRTAREMHAHLFGDAESDWIVSDTSQRGRAANHLQCLPILDHCSETGEPCMITEVKDFLRIAGTIGAAKHATVRTPQSATPEPAGDAAKHHVDRSVPDAPMKTNPLLIAAPLGGASYSPGDTLEVVVHASKSAAAVAAVTSSGESSILMEGPFRWEFTIPADAAGDYTVTAIERRADGGWTTDERVVRIRLPSAIQTLTVEPRADRLPLLPGAVVPLHVTGGFEDGATRDVTTHGSGTTYASDAPLVATISDGGEIRSVGIGEATITVSNGGLVALLRVESPVRLDSIDGTVGSLVHLTGEGYGPKRGRVRIGGRAARVVEWSDSGIDCIVGNVAGGGLVDVQVQAHARGRSGRMTFRSAFRVAGPQLTAVTGGRVSAGEELALEGRYFGRRRGVVSLVSGKVVVRLKVRAWTMDAESGASQVRVVVPRRVLEGTYEVLLRNSAGESRTNLIVNSD